MVTSSSYTIDENCFAPGNLYRVVVSAVNDDSEKWDLI